ncbi:MAG TPA: glycoside hydrolase family 140 protein [Nitrososphaerales archaeon]|nr:glycoside hydrolase family 140 protein [Nitrososphaerales archaeon]
MLHSAKYPLKISDNKRYLVDQNGSPFLLQGEAAWSLIARATKEDVETYLKNRAEKGFNTVLVNILEHWFADKPPENLYGVEPFSIPNNFAAPNEMYFEHVDWVINKAAQYNIQVLLAPMYLGYPGTDEGWFNEILAASLSQCLEYGAYLGKRYADFDNILWSIGADRNPSAPGLLERLDLIALGIKEHDRRHLMTAQCEPESSSMDQFSTGGWVDFDAVYTYGIVHRKLTIEYYRKPTMPIFLIESTYEGEHNSSPAQIRRQAYWSVLCGGFGHIFGSFPVDVSAKGWMSSLETPGAFSMMRWGRLLGPHKWYDLIPDQKHQVVTDGLGEFRGLDFLSASFSQDMSTLIAYMPNARTITVDHSKLKGTKLRAWWYNPGTGESSNAGEFSTKSAVKHIPPKDGDWVFILEDASERQPSF